MIYVMSDIHGNMTRFKSILKQIKLKPDDKLYILGDVIDRFPNGIRILRLIMKMPNVEMLLGNHEYMMLNAIAPSELFEGQPWSPRSQEVNQWHWYNNGGKVTHNYMKHIRKDLRREIYDYLYKLPLNFDIEVNGVNYKLVHGSPEDDFANWHRGKHRDARHYAVWHRQGVYGFEPGDYTLIFGHTPTCFFSSEQLLKIWYSPEGHRIGIDCGGGYEKANPYDKYSIYGRLACLRLDDMAEFYSDDGGLSEAKYDPTEPKGIW